MKHAFSTTARERFRHWLTVPGHAILDTETTGLDGQAVIIEIAVLSTDGRVLLDTLVRPMGRILNSHMHGITDEMVREAPAWPNAYDWLCQALDASCIHTLIAYNAAFDRRMIQQCSPDGALALDLSWHCVMKATSAYLSTHRWLSLEQALKACGIARPPHHRALADCRLTLRLIESISSR